MTLSPDTVICIATFRRPLGLARCLEALATANLENVLGVVVADNDPEGREGLGIVEAFQAAGSPFRLTGILAGERGISQARNALVAEALKDERAAFIAMIDDDEWPISGWLESLRRVQRETSADIVGGPVERVFSKVVPAYLKNANLADFSQIHTGPVEFVDGTCNVLMSAQLFRESLKPWFDPAFGLLGGEDTDLFVGFKMRGATFAWSSDALVYEEMPGSRASVRWMLERAYRIGNTYGLVNRKRRPPGFGVANESLKISAAAAVSLITFALFFWSPPRRFEAARLAARVLGKLSGLLGRRHEEYRSVHGS